VKPLERLTHRVSFRTGIIVFAAMVILAISSMSARRVGLAVIAASVVGVPSATVAAAAENNGTAIRPFRVNVPEADLTELRRRVLATRWPEQETVADQSQGMPLALIRELARYWATDYDWRKAEARLNALPQFVTTIDGLDIHFIHVRSREKNALPLIITHGWPGSVLEQIKIIGPLTDPVAYGGKAEDAFDVVIPSMPGYGFSAKPTTTGWGVERMARAWPELMKRLGYNRYVAQGGDWVRLSSTTWRCRRLRDCWASTPTCRVPSQPTSIRRPSPATRRHPVSQPRKSAPTRGSSSRTSIWRFTR